MFYDSLMLTQYAAERLNKNNDDISCVTWVTGINGTTFLTRDRRIGILKVFGHAVDLSQSGSKKKCTVAALGHLRDFMDAIKQQPSEWEDLECS